MINLQKSDATNIFYIASSFFVILLNFFYTPLLKYGKTLHQDVKENPSKTKSKIESLFLSLRLPRSYFSHFYILGLLWLWLYAFLFKSTFTIKDTLILSLYTLQLVRRSYECIFITKSKASMHVFHYFAGLSFYTITPLHLSTHSETNPDSILIINIGYISCLVLAFMYNWMDQYKNHSYLASLKKTSNSKNTKNNSKSDYIFPEQFSVCCPHYANEIIMYLSLLLIRGEGFGLLVWLIVDLGVSANEQYKWYLKTFGEKCVGIRYRIFKGIF